MDTTSTTQPPPLSPYQCPDCHEWAVIGMSHGKGDRYVCPNDHDWYIEDVPEEDCP